MYVVIFLILIIYFVGLRANYSTDKGFNIKAKIFNPFIVIGIFLSLFFDVRNKIYWIYNNLNEVWSELLVKTGFIPPLLNCITWFLYLIVSSFIIILCFTLLFRKETTRILFLKLIPLVWVIESIEIYKIVALNNNIINNKVLILIIGIIVIGIIWFAIYKLYSSKGFVNFFNKKM